MKIVVLYNQANEDASIDERDVLVQRDAVSAALRQAGHEVAHLGCTLDLGETKTRLGELRPEAVFNLVEALGGTDRLAPLATLLLEGLGLPFTGSPTEALLATNSKLAAKRRMLQAGLPTPTWFDGRWWGEAVAVEALLEAEDGLKNRPTEERRAIVKAVWEHASFGIDDEAIVSFTPEAPLRELLRAKEAASGRPYFAEQFIAGREFNLTVLGGAEGPQVLPPAEIDFGAFPDDKPHIVGYRAKWDAASFEYHHTPRRFEYPTSDQPLLERLTELARRCWREFGLRGYARVDFRVDQAGQPWILEVNANPCLAPDAGFAAAVEQAGIGYHHAIQRIVQDALRNGIRPF